MDTSWLFSQINRCSHTKQLGWLGEQIVMGLLPKDRYIVHKPRKAFVGDLHVTHKETGEFLKVEVKTARRNKRGYFEFRLRKDDKHGKTNISHADVVLFFCVHESGLHWFYLIPVTALGPKQTSLTLPGTTTQQSSYRRYLMPSLQALMLSPGAAV